VITYSLQGIALRWCAYAMLPHDYREDTSAVSKSQQVNVTYT